jgi:hypothetical protein
MLSDERLRLHDGEDATPVDQPRQRDERNARRIVGAARLHLPLRLQSQLLSLEQVLDGKLCARSSSRRDQPHEITSDAQDGSQRGAGTRRGHDRRIVRDALTQPRPPSGYRTVNQGATRDTGRKLRRLALLRTTVTHVSGMDRGGCDSGSRSNGSNRATRNRTGGTSACTSR